MATNHGHAAPAKGWAYIMSKKWTYLAVAFIVFGTTVLALSALDLLPNPASEQAPVAPKTDEVTQTPSAPTLPESISIPKLNLSATVANPNTTDPTVLDQHLLKGAVRWPSSGHLGVQGENVVVFAHSSYLPVVHNQAYKTFDGIQNLSKGDQILVTGNGTTYVYEVELVAQANAQRDGIPLQVTGNKLTLVTCDSFATKSDRFVVVAHLVGSYPAESQSKG